jgi:hypothetical protein
MASRVTAAEKRLEEVAGHRTWLEQVGGENPTRMTQKHIDTPIDAAARGLWVSGNAEQDLPALEETYKEPPVKAVKSIRRFSQCVVGAALTAEADQKAEPPDFETAKALRDLLLAVVTLLFMRNDDKRAEIAEIQKGQGHEDLADDLLKLIKMVFDDWKTVEKKDLVNREQVDQAAAIATEIIAWTGRREGSKKSMTRELEQRAWTLMADAYDEIRDYTYVLYRKDLEAWNRLYPSLYTPTAPTRGRVRGSRGEESGNGATEGSGSTEDPTA